MDVFVVFHDDFFVFFMYKLEIIRIYTLTSVVNSYKISVYGFKFDAEARFFKVFHDLVLAPRSMTPLWKNDLKTELKYCICM